MRIYREIAGQKSETIKIIKVDEEYEDFMEWFNKSGKFQYGNGVAKAQKIPCGHCINCKITKSREWANRCVLEASQYENNYFVTLTYDPEHLPLMDNMEGSEGKEYCNDGTWAGMLVKDDMTKFIRSLRDYYRYHYGHEGIRFFGAGEYGDNFQRPHYHLILFNLPIYDLETAEKNWFKQQYWESETISKIWGKGIVKIAEVNWTTCAYVARYVMKKRYGEKSADYYAAKGQTPEFVNMSRNPGIGANYFKEHMKEIYKTDEIILKGMKEKTHTSKPPKYFDGMYEILYPEEMAAIKEKRKIAAEESEKVKLTYSTMTEKQRYDIKERTMIMKSKLLKRNLAEV